jgi:hypothetical protein
MLSEEAIKQPGKIPPEMLLNLRETLDNLPETPPVKKPGFILPLNAIFAGAALTLAVAALGVALFFDPLGKGMAAYDFSTPRAALEANAQMVLNKDIRALVEFSVLMESKQIQEKLKTLEVHRQAEWGGKVILFISYTANGMKRHEVQGFDKDAKTGYWQFTPISPWDEGLKADNPRLAELIDSWELKGELK